MTLPPLASAQPWLAPGNLAIRSDVQLLADAGILKGPATTWPMSWPDIARQVMATEPTGTRSAGVEAALARLQRLARRAQNSGFSGLEASIAGAERPTTLRTFNDTPRENGEAELAGSWVAGRFAAQVDVTAVMHPDDGNSVRPDGSYVGVTLGNYMVSAGWMDRWWGPGWEGSLILSTNARPIPSIALERNYSDAFETRWLRWLGPWRVSASMGELDRSDVAVPHARFFAARFNFRPQPWLEVGLSRTAQWCGEGRPCDWSTFGKLLVGQDNRDTSLPESREPGNQLAGYDVRIRSPWRQLPAALYAQLIGEDEAGGLPSRFLGLFGAEFWSEAALGSYRIHVEYADTACDFSRREPTFGCAYRNSLYPQGYTYQGRAIGDALGGDGRMYSVGALLVRPDGVSWSLLARKAQLNRAAVLPDPTHPVSPSRDELKNLELQYNRAFVWGELGIGLGVDDFGGPLHTGSEMRGFVQLRQGF